MRKNIVDVNIYNVYSAPDENYTYVQLNSTQCDVIKPNCTTYTGADFMMGEIGALTGTFSFSLHFYCLLCKGLRFRHCLLAIASHNCAFSGFDDTQCRGSHGWIFASDKRNEWHTMVYDHGYWYRNFYLLFKIGILISFFSVISWVASPAMSGLISVLFYLFIKFTCLKRVSILEFCFAIFAFAMPLGRPIRIQSENAAILLLVHSDGEYFLRIVWRVEM